MKKILSLSIVLIFLLNIFPPVYSADAGLNNIDNDASLAFVLGTVGSYSTDPGEIVDGKRSVVGSYQGTETHTSVLYSNPDIMPLQPNKTYTLSFRYKVLETLSDGFEALFFSPAGADAPSKYLDGEKGDYGDVSLTVTLKNFDDYRLLWTISGKGALAIDSVKLTMEGTDVPVAVADFEEHDVVSFGGIKYNFSHKRTDYRLDLTPSGTAVVHKTSGRIIAVVPFGEKMAFKGNVIKYSKDTDFIIHHVSSHAAHFGDWNEVAGLPVDFVRTGPMYTLDDKPPHEAINDRFNTIHFFPDRTDKVVTCYVNMTEFGGVNDWDPSFDPAWDKNGDDLIDEDAGPLPDYVDKKVFNASWKNYVAKFWTDSWKEELKKKIDLAAAQHFDGIDLDVMEAFYPWHNAYPNMDAEEIVRNNAELLAFISDYAKKQYGTAFTITGNCGGAQYYFPDFGSHMDGNTFENGFFRWDGSGIIDGYVRSASKDKFESKTIDFLRSQGLQILNVEHLGTGTNSGIEFTNYDDKLTAKNMLLLFGWAIESGSTPFLTTLNMDVYYKIPNYTSLPAPKYMAKPDSIPRFTRILDGVAPFTDTRYNDWVLGSEENDVINTGLGKDLIYGGPGDDQINGGLGGDGAYYIGKISDYDIITDKGITTVTAKKSGEGTDLLIGVEYLIFSDTTEKIPDIK